MKNLSIVDSCFKILATTGPGTGGQIQSSVGTKRGFTLLCCNERYVPGFVGQRKERSQKSR